MSGIQAGELQVFAAPLPFSNKNVSHKARHGQTIAEIIDDVMPVKHEGIGAVVMIDGKLILRSEWATLKPELGELINIRVVPMGGGGGGKNPIASILSIAVLIAAPYAAGAILGTTLASTTVIGSLTYGQLLGGVIGMVGRLAINALVPPPKQSNANGVVTNPSESPTQFIEGARNNIDPFGVVPVCLGVNRMFPPQAAKPYTETAGSDQFVRQLFTYGFGDEIQISDLKIGETAISEFDGVEIEHRLHGDLHESTGLFSNDVDQEDFSILLNQVDGFTTRTTHEGIDEATIDFTFSSGLAAFDSQGSRGSFTVALEMQYALTGQSPQVWSSSFTSYTPYSGTTLVSDEFAPPSGSLVGYRRDLIMVDIYSGLIYRVPGMAVTDSQYSAQQDSQPANAVRIGTAIMKSTRNEGDDTITMSVYSLTDDRQAALFGSTLQTSADFTPSIAGANIAVSGGAIKVGELTTTGATTEALRISLNVKFPTNGQYDIRVRRLTGDTDNDQIIDKVYLTAIKSITHVAPVNMEGINGTAVRIKGTNQLNGALDQFNVIAANVIPDYRPDTGEWVPAVTSNPASIYRYVLQGMANAKALADSKILIADLEAWHVYCTERGYTYNRIIDYETSVDDVLADVASAGAATPAIIDGKRTVVVDRVKPNVVQVVTPRNSWDYRGELSYPDYPHGFRVQFRNAAKGYQNDERIVYADGYDESNATIFERLEYVSCTNSNLAYKHGRRYLATMILRPEIHTFMMDVEHLVFTRGNRIKLAHDVPIIGVGDGRITDVDTGIEYLDLIGGGPLDLIGGGGLQLIHTSTGTRGFSIDDVVEFISGKTYYVRIRKADGSQIYRELIAPGGVHNTFEFVNEIAAGDPIPEVGDLCYFVEAGGELDLVVSKIEPQDDLTARVTCVDYAPEIFDAETGEIPPFNSHVTTPLQLLRPNAPVLVSAQSDESVMLINSDGTYTPRLVISLLNVNDGEVFPVVQYRESGTTAYRAANSLQLSPTLVILTGLSDGVYYDIQIRYQRSGSAGILSKPLLMNNYLFLGAAGPPAQVTGLKVNVVGDQANFKWNKNTDIDISHYFMKFSRLTTGATWETAQTLDDTINETQYSSLLQTGTYLLKAVDRLGVVSELPAVITTFGEVVSNVVDTLDETATSPTFSGTKVNVVKSSGALVLADLDSDGYYYFSRTIDFGDSFNANLSASVTANGAFTNNVYAMANVFTQPDMFAGGNNNVFDMPDVYNESDIFGIGLDSWMVELQYRSTFDNSAGSPVAWTDWQPFIAGIYNFRAVQFRLLMRSLSPVTGITPQVSGLVVVIDMPDRIERDDDLSVTGAGKTVTYSTPFAATPSLSILLQDGDNQDEIVFTAKTASGFTFKVYNAGTAGYVTRTFDFIASGYGRG